MNEGLEHGHQAISVIPQHAHDTFARGPVVALDTAHLHRVDEHARKTEGNLLWKLVAVHGNLEAVAEVDVEDLTRVAVKHKVRRVPIAEPQDVADHGHHGQAARVACTPVQPLFRVVALEPENLVKVLAGRVRQRRFEHLELLHKRQRFIVGGHLDHEAMLDVQQNLARLAIVANQRVQCVRIRHPAQHACVMTEWRDCVALDTQIVLVRTPVRSQQRVDEAEELHCSLVLAQILVSLEQKDIVLSVLAVHNDLARPLLAGDNLHVWPEHGDADSGPIDTIRAGDRKLEVPRVEQVRAHVLQLEHGQLRQLLVDSAEHVVVEVPRLVQRRLGVALRRLRPRVAPGHGPVEAAAGRDRAARLGDHLLVAPEELVRVVQLAPERLLERGLTEGRGTCGELNVQRQQRVQHASHIPVTEVQPRRVLEAFVPLLVPQNRDANELTADQQRLVHERARVLLEHLHERLRRLTPFLFRRFDRHTERIH